MVDGGLIPYRPYLNKYDTLDKFLFFLAGEHKGELAEEIRRAARLAKKSLVRSSSEHRTRNLAPLLRYEPTEKNKAALNIIEVEKPSNRVYFIHPDGKREYVLGFSVAYIRTLLRRELYKQVPV